MKKNILQKGFTLIEMLVAMAIFVIFLGLMLGSYSLIVKSLRDTEEYRIMYSESRNVFNELLADARDSRFYGPEGTQGLLDCPGASGDNGFNFYSKDFASVKTYCFGLDAGSVLIREFDGGTFSKEYNLTTPEVKVESVTFELFPKENPYFDEIGGAFDPSTYFHPSLRVSVEFSKASVKGEDFELELSTTISSRVYN